jgi:hypothetical protein
MPSPRKKTTSRRKKSAPSESTKASNISYEKHMRTDRIIDWLIDNADDRIRLFSDNVQDASEEGRPQRKSKTGKNIYYAKISKAIFANDPEKDSYTADPIRYTKSVENHLNGLKKKYRNFCIELGRTGAGLKLEEINLHPELKSLKGESNFFFSLRI